MMMALVHDDVELETGDIPGNTKRKYPALKEFLVQLEFGIVEHMYNDLPLEMAEELRYCLRQAARSEDDLEAQIIKYVDNLDANTVALNEIKMGNYHLDEAEHLTASWLAEKNWPWLQQLREKVFLP